MTSEIAGDGNVKQIDANSSIKEGSKGETGNSDQSGGGQDGIRSSEPSLLLAENKSGAAPENLNNKDGKNDNINQTGPGQSSTNSTALTVRGGSKTPHSSQKGQRTPLGQSLLRSHWEKVQHSTLPGSAVIGTQGSKRKIEETGNVGKEDFDKLLLTAKALVAAFEKKSTKERNKKDRTNRYKKRELNRAANRLSPAPLGQAPENQASQLEAKPDDLSPF